MNLIYVHKKCKIFIYNILILRYYINIVIIMGECYICTLETNELSKCKCKNMFLHLECQLKLLDKRNDKKCSICLQEYTNINVIIIEKKKISKKGKKLILFIVLEILALGALFFEILVLLDIVDNEDDYTINISKEEDYFILIVTFIMFFIIIIGTKPIYNLIKYIIVNKAFFDIEKNEIVTIKLEEDINRIL
tara:strand:- start:1533 stop:2111 length:579 start_codon:yes stop_codon:yes gene_type:complete